tara:strand:+ start:549 stop:923 length:375 start_codon:yes stop_codon:yes gene_type:complete
MDKLDKMFALRESFMVKLRETNPQGASPEWPIDLLDKSSQQHVRDMALRGVEEMFEALQHLKNWKPHRMTEVSEFNTDLFLEEVVDAFNYFLSVLILTGFSSDDLFQAYEDKDFVIRERIDDGY